MLFMPVVLWATQKDEWVFSCFESSSNFLWQTLETAFFLVNIIVPDLIIFHWGFKQSNLRSDISCIILCALLIRFGECIFVISCVDLKEQAGDKSRHAEGAPVLPVRPPAACLCLLLPAQPEVQLPLLLPSSPKAPAGPGSHPGPWAWHCVHRDLRENGANASGLLCCGICCQDLSREACGVLHEGSQHHHTAALKLHLSSLFSPLSHRQCFSLSFGYEKAVWRHTVAFMVHSRKCSENLRILTLGGTTENESNLLILWIGKLSIRTQCQRWD